MSGVREVAVGRRRVALIHLLLVTAVIVVRMWLVGIVGGSRGGLLVGVLLLLANWDRDCGVGYPQVGWR